MRIERYEDGHQAAAQKLLRKYSESSMFLLSNQETYGSDLTDHMNSGNFCCLLSDSDEMLAVFCLTRRGNLLIQTDRRDDYFYWIYNQCLVELKDNGIPLKGLLGPWEVTGSFWEKIQDQNSGFVTTFESKEVLYAFSAADGCSASGNSSTAISNISSGKNRVERLAPEDYDEWFEMQNEFFKEAKLPEMIDKESYQQTYLSNLKMFGKCGIKIDGKLAAVVAINAKFDKIAQVGGVFTFPEHRRKGLSKLCMAEMMQDLMDNEGCEQLILFIGEDNVASRSVYEAVGFKNIGYFGLLFGSDRG